MAESDIPNPAPYYGRVIRANRPVAGGSRPEQRIFDVGIEDGAEALAAARQVYPELAIDWNAEAAERLPRSTVSLLGLMPGQVKERMISQ